MLPFFYGGAEEDALVMIFISSTNKDVVTLDSCWLITHVIVFCFFDFQMVYNGMLNSLVAPKLWLEAKCIHVIQSICFSFSIKEAAWHSL